MDINNVLQEVSRLLIPGQVDPARGPIGVAADVWLYVILFFAMIVLFSQPEGSQGTTIIMAAVIISIFMDKVGAFTMLQGGRHICSFGTLMIRALMFLGHFITAGISGNPKSRAPAIIGGLLALAYTFALWFFEMQGGACPMLSRDV